MLAQPRSIFRTVAVGDLRCKRLGNLPVTRHARAQRCQAGPSDACSSESQQPAPDSTKASQNSTLSSHSTHPPMPPTVAALWPGAPQPASTPQSPLPFAMPAAGLAAAALVVALGLQLASAGTASAMPQSAMDRSQQDQKTAAAAALDAYRRGPPPFAASAFAAKFMIVKKELIHYRALQVLSLPTTGKIAALFAVGLPLCIVGAVLHRMAAGCNWQESLIKTYYVLNSVPGIDISAEQTKQAVFVLNLVHVASLFTFAILVGVLTDEVARAVEAVRVGNHLVPETRHTVILGWDSQRTPLLLQQLLHTHAGRGSSRVRPPFVLLLDPTRCSKEEVDHLLEEQIGHSLGREVVTRQGNALRPEDLQRVSAGQAGTVILTAIHKGDSQLDNSSTLVATLAALHSVGQPGRQQSVVVQTGANSPDWDITPAGNAVCRMLADQGRPVTSVADQRELTDVLAQAAIHQGLSAVFEQVCGSQGTGRNTEFHVKRNHQFVGKTFREARLSYEDVQLCGVCSRKTGVARLNSSESYIIQPDDSLVFLARHAKHITSKVVRDMGADTPPTPLSPRVVVTDPSLAKVQHIVVLMSDPQGAAQLLTSMADVQGHASITLVGRVPEDSAQQRLVEGALSVVRKAGRSAAWVREDATSQRALLNAGVSTAQAVVVAPPWEYWSREDMDAQVLACALQLVDVLHSSTAPRDAPLRLVGGLMSEGTRSVLHSVTSAAGDMEEQEGARETAHGRSNHRVVPDVLLNDSLMTGLLGQVAGEPELQGVFKELLSSQGAELYTRTLPYFNLPHGQPMVWQEVAEHVRRHGEMAVGVSRPDGSVSLSLKPNDVCSLSPEDRLVVLADD